VTPRSGTQSGKKGTKRPASDVDSDDDSITAFSDNEDKQFDKVGITENLNPKLKFTGCQALFLLNFCYK
jgi:hypothetical protein